MGGGGVAGGGRRSRSSGRGGLLGRCWRGAVAGRGGGNGGCWPGRCWGRRSWCWGAGGWRMWESWVDGHCGLGETRGGSWTPAWMGWCGWLTMGGVLLAMRHPSRDWCRVVVALWWWLLQEEDFSWSPTGERGLCSRSWSTELVPQGWRRQGVCLCRRALGFLTRSLPQRRMEGERGCRIQVGKTYLKSEYARSRFALRQSLVEVGGPPKARCSLLPFLYGRRSVV